MLLYLLFLFSYNFNFFSVKVTEVLIKDGDNILTQNVVLTVDEGIQKSLSCAPGFGRPSPNIHWHIGSSYKTASSSFAFIPSNADHAKHIYCVADNFPNDGDMNDVTSEKVKLFVNGKETFI